LGERVCSLESDKVALSEKVGALESNKVTLEERVCSLESDKVTLGERVCSLESEKVTLEERVGALVVEKDGYHNELLDTRVRCEEIELRLAEAVGRACMWEALLTEAQSKLEVLDTESALKQAQVSALSRHIQVQEANLLHLIRRR